MLHFTTIQRKIHEKKPRESQLQMDDIKQLELTLERIQKKEKEEDQNHTHTHIPFIRKISK